MKLLQRPWPRGRHPRAWYKLEDVDMDDMDNMDNMNVRVHVDTETSVSTGIGQHFDTTPIAGMNETGSLMELEPSSSGGVMATQREPAPAERIQVDSISFHRDMSVDEEHRTSPFNQHPLPPASPVSATSSRGSHSERPRTASEFSVLTAGVAGAGAAALLAMDTRGDDIDVCVGTPFEDEMEPPMVEYRDRIFVIEGNYAANRDIKGAAMLEQRQQEEVEQIQIQQTNRGLPLVQAHGVATQRGAFDERMPAGEDQPQQDQRQQDFTEDDPTSELSTISEQRNDMASSIFLPDSASDDGSECRDSTIGSKTDFPHDETVEDELQFIGEVMRRHTSSIFSEDLHKSTIDRVLNEDDDLDSLSEFLETATLSGVGNEQHEQPREHANFIPDGPSPVVLSAPPPPPPRAPPPAPSQHQPPTSLLLPWSLTPHSTDAEEVEQKVERHTERQIEQADSPLEEGSAHGSTNSPLVEETLRQLSSEHSNASSVTSVTAGNYAVTVISQSPRARKAPMGTATFVVNGDVISGDEDTSNEEAEISTDSDSDTASDTASDISSQEGSEDSAEIVADVNERMKNHLEGQGDVAEQRSLPSFDLVSVLMQQMTTARHETAAEQGKSSTSTSASCAYGSSRSSRSAPSSTRQPTNARNDYQYHHGSRTRWPRKEGGSVRSATRSRSAFAFASTSSTGSRHQQSQFQVQEREQRFLAQSRMREQEREQEQRTPEIQTAVSPTPKVIASPLRSAIQTTRQQQEREAARERPSNSSRAHKTHAAVSTAQPTATRNVQAASDASHISASNASKMSHISLASSTNLPSVSTITASSAPVTRSVQEQEKQAKSAPTDEAASSNTKERSSTGSKSKGSFFRKKSGTTLHTGFASWTKKMRKNMAMNRKKKSVGNDADGKARVLDGTNKSVTASVPMTGKTKQVRIVIPETSTATTTTTTTATAAVASGATGIIGRGRQAAPKKKIRVYGSHRGWALANTPMQRAVRPPPLKAAVTQAKRQVKNQATRPRMNPAAVTRQQPAGQSTARGTAQAQRQTQAATRQLGDSGRDAPPASSAFLSIDLNSTTSDTTLKPGESSSFSDASDGTFADELSQLQEDVIAVVKDVFVPSRWYDCTCGVSNPPDDAEGAMNTQPAAE